MGQSHDGLAVVGAADSMELAAGGLPVTGVEVGCDHGHTAGIATHDDIVGQLFGLHMDVKRRTIIIDDKL